MWSKILRFSMGLIKNWQSRTEKMKWANRRILMYTPKNHYVSSLQPLRLIPTSYWRILLKKKISWQIQNNPISNMTVSMCCKMTQITINSHDMVQGRLSLSFLQAIYKNIAKNVFLLWISIHFLLLNTILSLFSR